MEAKRFSKSFALDALDARAARIAKEQRFDRSNGTSQLAPRGTSEADCARIERAVQYGRMRAFEEFGLSIQDGFSCDA